MKKWKNVNICGIKYTLYFSNSEETPELKNNDACTISGIAHIYIQEDLPKERLNDILLHEVLHAILEDSGLLYWLQHATGKKGKKLFQFEEQLIRSLTPHLMTTLQELNLWRLK